MTAVVELFIYAEGRVHTSTCADADAVARVFIHCSTPCVDCTPVFGCCLLPSSRSTI